jgi:hypothetical protein
MNKTSYGLILIDKQEIYKLIVVLIVARAWPEMGRLKTLHAHTLIHESA